MPAPRLIASCGDSLTHDPFPNEYSGSPAVGWWNPFPALFTTTGIEFRDHAQSGRTTATFLATDWAGVLAIRPRWAFIMFGTNDHDEITLAQYTANLSRMFRELKAIDCEPIMVTPPPFFYAAPPPLGYTTKVRRPYLIEPLRDAAIVQADTDGVEYIDLYDLMADLYDATGFTAAWTTYGLNTYSAGADRTHWLPAGASAAAAYIAAALPTVSPSLASYLLTLYSEPVFATLAQLKTAMGEGSSSYDTDLQLILDGVVSSMKAWMGRNIACKRYTAESHSLATASTKLVLRHRPIVSVVEVRLDGETVSQDDYEILLDEGVLYNASGWPAGTYHLEVDYTAGYATVPQTLQSAAIAQARYVWTLRKDGGDRFGLAQRAEASGGSTAFIVEDWYPSVLSAMRQYRRLA